MGSKAATTLIKNIRINIGENLPDGQLTDANAGTNWTNTEILEALNKGKDREWDIVRSVREDYFETVGDTSITLAAGTKSYTLPSLFRQMKGIKITTSGYESLRFRQVDQSTEEFKVRDALPQNSNSYSGDIIYDIIGVRTLLLADFVPVSLATSLNYISALADYTLSVSSTSDLNDENAEFREAYATWKLLGKNPADTRISFWSNEIKRLTDEVKKSVAKRDISGSEYVESYDPS